MLLRILSNSIKMWFSCVVKFCKVWYGLHPSERNIAIWFGFVILGVILLILVIKYGFIKSVSYCFAAGLFCVILLCLGFGGTKLYQRLGGNKTVMVDGIQFNVY